MPVCPTEELAFYPLSGYYYDYYYCFSASDMFDPALHTRVKGKTYVICILKIYFQVCEKQRQSDIIE